MTSTGEIVEIFGQLEKDLAESGVSEQWDTTYELGEVILQSYGALFQYEEAKASNAEIYVEFLETGEPLTEDDRLNLKNVSQIKKRIDKQLKEIRKKAGGKKA